uniref:Putative secreted protein n=1 Tax=Ixodes ricinus TaxID=34613 RepID=A0A6B0UX02_IXORI
MYIYLCRCIMLIACTQAHSRSNDSRPRNGGSPISWSRLSCRYSCSRLWSPAKLFSSKYLILFLNRYKCLRFRSPSKACPSIWRIWLLFKSSVSSCSRSSKLRAGTSRMLLYLRSRTVVSSGALGRACNLRNMQRTVVPTQMHRSGQVLRASISAYRYE